MNEENFKSKSGKKEKTEEKIALYIEYLKKEHNLAISVHLADKYMYVFFYARKLRNYNIHVNPYCFYVKSDPVKHQKCLKCQKMVLSKCKTSEKYTGICYAGVSEYIHGIFIDDIAAGFISISGYRDQKIPVGIDKYYDTGMKNEEIPVGILDTLIPPLCIMIEKLIGEIGCDSSEDDVYSQMLAYLEEHHTDVSVSELARRFCYSKSYVSHMFKKRSGYTLKHYCNLLKIKDAKALLEETRMSVSEIAFSVGFNNFSYFINTFKSITGLTPLAWRKRN